LANTRRGHPSQNGSSTWGTKNTCGHHRKTNFPQASSSSKDRRNRSPAISDIFHLACPMHLVLGVVLILHPTQGDPA